MANKEISQTENKDVKLSDLYRDRKQDLDMLQSLLEKSGLKLDDLSDLFDNKVYFESVPLSIFRTDLSPLESLVMFLRDKGHDVGEISRLLCRNNKTIWTAYYNAKKKSCSLDYKSEYYVPLKIFCNRDLSILENLSTFLRDEMHFSFVKIAEIVGKNKNTIWTTYRRAKDKL